MALLSHTPFTGWALPGIALWIQALLAVPTLIKASGHWALAASYLAGLALVAWIFLQLLVLQHCFFPQADHHGHGRAALEVLLARIWQRRAQGRGSGGAGWFYRPLAEKCM